MQHLTLHECDRDYEVLSKSIFFFLNGHRDTILHLRVFQTSKNNFVFTQTTSHKYLMAVGIITFSNFVNFKYSYAQHVDG